jgi:hypothetical protein
MLPALTGMLAYLAISNNPLMTHIPSYLEISIYPQRTQKTLKIGMWLL